MPLVDVTVHHKTYRVVCGEGQEEHLKQLADKLNQRMYSLSETLGKGSDSILLLMSALMLEDELAESYAKIEDLKQGTADALEVVGPEKYADISLEAEKKAVAQANVALAGAMDNVSSYIDTLAQKLDALNKAEADS